MPYQRGNRLPAERASKIGHLEVIQSPLVKKLCESFNNPDIVQIPDGITWQVLPKDGNPLNIIFSADGSIQTIEDNKPPFKAISFIKAALLKMDQHALGKLDKENPHPFTIRDIMKESALFHATSFPLRHVVIPDKTIYHAVREILFESVKDIGFNNSLDGAMMETLKWIAFEKWNDEPKKEIEKFGCPHCDMDRSGKSHATLPFNQESGNCPNCSNEIFITDMFGLHQNMAEDFAPNQVAFDYMSVAETLLIFTPVRYFWENRREVLKNTLLIKDGPLSLRATLAKLSAPIRRFFSYAKEKDFNIHMFGQEKSGVFFEHLQLIGESAPDNSFFYPNNTYIRNEIQHSNSGGIYGLDTNYGAKIFIKINDYNKFILNIPTGLRGEGVENPTIEKLIGFSDMVATLPKLLSNRFEGALVPIELVNGIASLSTYPSAKVLDLFSKSVSD
ncbi:MAG: hypothetical protein IH852_08385 [Bacteroidetes bacterium]|nr:hypothetical protein [Bacteroidota bacterium]